MESNNELKIDLYPENKPQSELKKKSIQTIIKKDTLAHSFDLDQELGYLCYKVPVLSGIFNAHCNHYPVRIRPDDIWLLILQSFGCHVNKNSEILRKYFVNFDGKKELKIPIKFFAGGAAGQGHRLVPGRAGIAVEQLQALDFSILYGIQDHLRCLFLDLLMPRITMLGEYGAVWILAALVLLGMKRHRRGGLTLAAALIAGLILCNLLLKPLAARPRPCWLDTGIPLLVPMPLDYSFPSGHSVSSFIERYTVPILKKYLDNERLSLTQIADRMNFTSLSYFSRYCTKHLGQSPSDYRRSLQPKG